MKALSDRELFIAAVGATGVIFLLVVLILNGMLLLQRRRQRHQKDLQQLEGRYNEEVLKTRLEIQEETFRTISQEVHDNIGQMLSLAKLHLNTLDRPNSNREQKLEEARALVSKSIFDLRDLSKSLNTDAITSMGLPRALETEVQRVQKAGTLTGIVTVKGEVRPLDGRRELLLFRIAQEALQNIIKHAEAATVSMLLQYEVDELELLISDNGRGFDTSNADGEGSGLRNMRNRAQLLGGNLELSSTAGKGSTLHLTIPINNNHGDHSTHR